MATIANFGVPGIASYAGAASILHPKMSYRFGVYFRCRTTADEGVAQAAMSIMSTQVIACDLPTRHPNLLGSLKGPSRGFNFKVAAIDPSSGLVITFQEDVSNKLMSALNFLEEHVDKLEIIVAQLDGNDGVVYAHVFGGVRLHSIHHSQLSYGVSGDSLTGILTTGNETAQLNCTISNTSNATSRVAVKFVPTHWQHGILDTNIQEFLEKL